MSTENQQNTAVAVSRQQIEQQVLTHVQGLVTNKNLVLPPNYSAENAIKSAYLLMGDMDLTKYTPASIVNSLMKMVVQGLNPDKNQLYFIPYGNKLQMQRSYFGNLALAKRVGGVVKHNANVIYKDDVFEYEINPDNGNVRIIKHETKLENIDDNNIRGAYCILTFTDGSTYIEVMNIAQIKKAWLQGATRGNSPAHNNFTGEMCKKSVFNRACKNFINTTDDASLYVEDEIETDNVKETVKQTIETNANTGPTIDIEHEEVEAPVVEQPNTAPNGELFTEEAPFAK